MNSLHCFFLEMTISCNHMKIPLSPLFEAPTFKYICLPPKSLVVVQCVAVCCIRSQRRQRQSDGEETSEKRRQKEEEEEDLRPSDVEEKISNLLVIEMCHVGTLQLFVIKY